MNYDTLRDVCNDLEVEIARLKEEVAYFKGLYETTKHVEELEHETIQKYHRIFMLQESELEKLRGKLK